MAISSSKIAILVRRYRIAKGWTQDELSQRSGIGMRTISDIERGLSRHPHRDTIQQLISAFGLQGDVALEFEQTARSTRDAGSVDPIMRHFPQPATPHLGRAADIALALRTIARPDVHLLSLVGPAGVGKTRMAIEIARQSISSNHTMNPWYFIDISQAATREEIIHEIIHQCDIIDSGASSPQDMLYNWLYQQNKVIILDNFEQAISATPLILELLAQHTHLVLCVTSRIPLKIPGEIVQEVTPFPIPNHRQLTKETLRQEPALTLFEAIAQSVQPDFVLTLENSRIIARICAHFDGLPLGIELIATQIARYSPGELLRQLSRFVDKLMPDFLPPLVEKRPLRQQTMSNAIAWSYDRLDIPTQIFFRRICTFAGEFDVSAAQAIGDPHQSLGIDTLDALTLLLDHHLITSVDVGEQVLEPRFLLLNVIRNFGRDMLVKRQEMTALRQLHAQYYTRLLQQYEVDLIGELQVTRLHLFERNYSNIMQALRYVRDEQDIVLGVDLVNTLWWYWEKRRTLTEGREWIGYMITLLENTHTPVKAVEMLRIYYSAAVLANAQGDVQEALRFGQSCLRFCQETQDPGRIGQAHTLLGTIARTSGDIEGAFREYEEALTVLRRIDSPRQLVPVLNNLSALAIDRGDFARAKELLEESLDIKQLLGDHRGRAVGLINLGEWYKEHGEYEEALNQIAEAESIFRELDDQTGMAMAANNAGEIELIRHAPRQAIQSFNTALTLFQRSENHNGSAMVLRFIGDAYLELGDATAALDAWQNSLIAHPTGPHAVHCTEQIAMLGMRIEPRD